VSGAASPRWPAGMTPGLARLRANGGEAIRAKVLADDAAEMASVRAANASAAIVANSGAELARILAAHRHGVAVTDIEERESSATCGTLPNRPIEARITRRPANGSHDNIISSKQGAAASTPAPGALAPETLALLAAVAYAPPLRDLEPKAKIGVWIPYKTIHESDRPHGLNRRRVPGFMTTLFRRGLVDCRAERAGKYSACVTAAGVALLAVQP
jgi:hypothetical protein